MKANKLIVPVLAIATLALYSCDSNKSKAENLGEEANTAFQKKNYEEALMLLDSIDKTYPSEVEVRRSYTTLRARIIEGQTVRMIESADSLLATLDEELAGLAPNFSDIAPAYQGGVGYRICKSILPSKITTSSGIEPRISQDDNTMSLLVNLQNGKGDFNSITIKTPEGETSSDSFNTSRIVKEGTSRLISLMQEEVDSMSIWLAENPSESYTLIFNGPKEAGRIKLSSEMAKAIGITYRYSKALSDKRNALITREKLERRLALARNQAANAEFTQPEEGVGD